MHRGAWWSTVHGIAELVTTERLTHTQQQPTTTQDTKHTVENKRDNSPYFLSSKSLHPSGEGDNKPNEYKKYTVF